MSPGLHFEAEAPSGEEPPNFDAFMSCDGLREDEGWNPVNLESLDGIPVSTATANRGRIYSQLGQGSRPLSIRKSG